MTALRIALLGAANSIHLQRWANALVARGHAVSVLSQQRCDSTALDAAVECVWLPHWRGAGYVLNAPAVRRHATRWRADLLNAHYASGYGTTAALAGVQPTLLSVWGSDVYVFPNRGLLPRRLLRWNLARATAVASTSDAMAREVRRWAPQRDDIAITPFGVDTRRFAPAPRPAGPLTIGTVKTLAAGYGIDLLLRAFAGLKADADVSAAHPDCRLLVVGSGPDREALEALARQLGIQAATRFVDAVPHADVPSWLARLDVYVAASRFESFGVAVIEASACERPVVVSDAGGLPEVVQHGQTGFVTPVENVPALQAALKTLVLDAGLRERFGQQGRAFVESRYAWPRCVDRMEAVYRSLTPRP